MREDMDGRYDGQECHTDLGGLKIFLQCPGSSGANHD